MFGKQKLQFNIAYQHTARTTLATLGLVVLVCAYVISFGLFAGPVQPVEAAIPKYINFQGKLTAVSNGNNVANGTYAFQFKLYAASSGGSPLWTETWDGSSGPCPELTVAQGVFNTKLGACNSLASVDFTTGALYLSVNFDPGSGYDGEMSPRKQLVSSAFAFVANSVNGDGTIDIANTGSNQATIGYDSTNKLQVNVASNGLTTLTANGAGAGINLMGGNVGIGVSNPARTLTVVKSDNGTEPIVAAFANNLTQGIGLTYNTISAIGSNTNQNISLTPKGSGDFIITNGRTGVAYTPTSGNAVLMVNGGAAIGSGTYLDATVPTNGLLVQGSVGIANTSPSALLTLGTAGTTAGTLSMAGSTSGTITIQPQAAAGTYNFNLPTTAGTSGYVLTSAGGGASPMTWTDPSALGVRWNAIIAPTGNLSLAHGANTTAFTFNSVTTGTAMDFSSTSLTTGKLLQLTPGTSLTTGSALGITGATYNPGAGNSGNLLNLAFTNASSNTTGTSNVAGISIAPTISVAGSGGSQNTYGINIQNAAGTVGAGTQNIYGIYIGNQGRTNADFSYGLYVASQSGSNVNYAAGFGGDVDVSGVLTAASGGGPVLSVNNNDFQATGSSTSKLYLNVNTGKSQLGDIENNGNAVNMTIDDLNSVIEFNNYYSGNGFGGYIDKANGFLAWGDNNSNNTRITVDDGTQYIALGPAGSPTIGLRTTDGSFPITFGEAFGPSVDSTYSIGSSAKKFHIIYGNGLSLGTAATATGNIELNGSASGTVTIRPQDSAGSYNFLLPTTAGTSGHVLTSGGGASPMTWTDPAALGVRWNALVAPTGNLSLAHGANTTAFTFNSVTTGNAFGLSSSSLSSGTLFNLAVTGTAAASNTQKALNISTSGANATSSQTTYGGYLSNTHTGTSATNYGLYSEATSGTTNYGLRTTATGGTTTYGLYTSNDNAAGGTSAHTGAYIDARNLYASTTTIKGAQIQAGVQNFSSGATTVTGLQVDAGSYNNGGTVATAYGIDASIGAYNSASVTTGSIIRAYAADAGAATFGTLYGLNLSNWSTLSATTTYGIYMDTSIDQGATRYALYSSATSNSYMAGNLGLGDTSPAALLTVGNGDLFQVASNGNLTSSNAGTWTFSNDTNIVLSGGVNGLSFDTDVLSIDATNNRVGIGLTNPSVSLHVYDTIQVGSNGATNGLIRTPNNLEFTLDTDNDQGSNYFAFSLHGTTFGTGTELMRLTEGGNVGIGTASPTESLDSTGAIRVRGIANYGSGNSGLFMSYGDVANTGRITSITPGTAYRDLDIQSAVFKVSTGTGSVTEKLRVETSGVVGIGSTAPDSYDLGITKLITQGTGDSGISIISGTSSAGALYFGDGTDGSDAAYRGGVEYAHSTDSMKIWAGANSALPNLFLTSTGTVGIGINSPAAKLDIDSNSNSSSLRVRGAAETVEIADIYVQSGGRIVLDTKAGTGASAFIDLLGEDDEYGLILRDSTGASSNWANFYMNDAATDYLNVCINCTNAGQTGLVVAAGGNVGVGDTTPASQFTVGAGDLFQVNSFGDVFGNQTTLDGSTTANGAGTSSNTLILTSATNFNVGNYVKVDPTGANTCAGSTTVCYAKITAIAANTLTISPALTWDNGASVVEVHVPEIGGINLSEPLANRYGRGYFIDGIVTGNGTMSITDKSINLTSGNLAITGGNLGIAAGSASTPSLFFNGDPNTGIYSPGADTLNLATAGNDRLNISSTGKLTVTGGLSGTAFQVGQSGVVQDDVIIYNGGLCVDAANNACPGMTPGTIYAVDSAISRIDLAENYPSKDSNLAPGELVMIDDTNAEYIKRSNAGIDQKIIGVISTAPGITLGAGVNKYAPDKVFPLALVGRVPVKVTNENGAIEPGDFLAASVTVPGAAMRATKAGSVIGQALEGYSVGDNSTVSIGSIITFIKPTDFNGVTIEDQLAGLIFDYTDPLQTAQTSTEILEYLLAQLPNLDESNLSEITTDIVIAGAEVVSPNVTTQNLRTDFLSSATAEGGLEVASTTMFNGGLMVDSISSIGDLLSFEGDVEFFGTPYFTTDTAGFALVKAGVQTVDVVFSREYLAQPIVNASISFEQDVDQELLDEAAREVLKNDAIATAQTFLAEGITYVVTNKSKFGFTIVLSKPAPSDVKMSWTALAVRNATTFMSLDTPDGFVAGAGDSGSDAGAGDSGAGSGSGDGSGDGGTPPDDGGTPPPSDDGGTPPSDPPPGDGGIGG